MRTFPAAAIGVLLLSTACGSPAAPPASTDGALPSAQASPAPSPPAVALRLRGRLAKAAIPESVSGADVRVVRAVLWGTDSVSESSARSWFMEVTAELLAAERFGHLEELEQRCRSESSPFSDLTPWRAVFFDAFGSPHHGWSDPTWAGLHARVLQWTEISPGEAPAHLARGRAALGEARASSDAATRQRLMALAGEEAARARALAPDDPEVDRLELDIAGGRPQAARVFREATERHPDYVPLYLSRRSQIPRQDQKALVELLEESGERSRDSLGEGLYALLIGDSEVLERLVQEKLLDWPRLHRGYLDLLQRQPLSVPLHNRFCLAAAQAEDAATAEALFRRLGDQWDPDVWLTRESYAQTRAWAAEASRGASLSPMAPLPGELIPPGPEQPYARADAEARRMFHQVRNLLHRERYADLESLARTFRTQEVRFPWGGCALATFYSQLGEREDQAQRDQVLSHADQWQEAFPESPTPRVLRARSRLHGGDLAGARADLELPPHVEDDPHRHAELGAIASELGEKSAAADFARALELDPSCDWIWERRALTLLSHQGGRPGELAALAAEAARQHGAGVAAFLGSPSVLEAGAFTLAGLPFPLVETGFQALMAQYGPGPTLRNRAAWSACMAGDRAAAHRALDALGPDWQPRPWSSEAQVQRWKHWATHGTEPPPSTQPWVRLVDRGIAQMEPPSLLRSTTEVPAVAGTSFGFWVRRETWPGEEVNFSLTVHPPSGEPARVKGRLKPGRATQEAFMHRLPEEPVVGAWRLSLELEGRLVLEQAFTVSPEQSPAPTPSMKASPMAPPRPRRQRSRRPGSPPVQRNADSRAEEPPSQRPSHG